MFQRCGGHFLLEKLQSLQFKHIGKTKIKHSVTMLMVEQ